MRWGVLLLVFCFLGCDDELPAAVYADGSEWEPVMPFLPSRVPLAQMSDREQAQFFGQQGIQARGGGPTKTFVPTWTGFSSDPTGSVSYVDFGEIVVMWSDAGFSGVSDDVVMSLSGVPEEIRPRVSTRFVDCEIVNDAITYAGYAAVSPGSATGQIVFWIKVLDPTRPTHFSKALDEFENTGTKGLPVGWTIMYSK